MDIIVQLESEQVARRDLEIALVNVILVGAQIAELGHSRIRMIAEVAHHCSADVEAQTGAAVGIDLDDSPEVPGKSRQARGLVSAAEPGCCLLVVNEPRSYFAENSPVLEALSDAHSEQALDHSPRSALRR